MLLAVIIREWVFWILRVHVVRARDGHPDISRENARGGIRLAVLHVDGVVIRVFARKGDKVVEDNLKAFDAGLEPEGR